MSTLVEGHNLIPILAICGYLNYPNTLQINPYPLFIISVVHNILLAAFSAYIFISLSQILFNNGIVFRENYYFQDEKFDRLMFYFYISKYYEFIDTFLIYLQRKKPLFLQKYHHVGVVLVWHLFYFYRIEGIWTATLLNSFVHSIMYTYYLGSLLKISIFKYIKKYITTIQLLQFFALYINFYIYRPPIVSTFHYFIIKITGLFGTGLVILFADFYRKTYIA